MCVVVQGCLYNIRKDPAESHNLWSRAGKIALLLTSRLRALWAAQSRRGKLALDVAADPANYNYTWMPWIKDVNYDEEEYFELNNYNSLLTDSKQGESTATHKLVYPQISNNKGSTVASPVNCNETVGIRHFLCILRSVF